MSIAFVPGTRVRLTNNHNLGSAASAATWGIWIKLVGSTALTGDDLSNHNGLHRDRGGTANVIQQRIWTNPTGVLNINSPSAPTADAWTFVVLTHDQAAGQVLYVNGTSVATASVLEPMATLANTVEYLGDAVPNFDTGDEVRVGGKFTIQGKALSGAEVSALYANRSGGGGTAKPQDHVDTGITIQCSAFDQTTGTVTNGDTGLADLGNASNPWINNTGTVSWVNDDPGHNWSSVAPDYEYSPANPAYYIPSTIADLLHGGDCRAITLGDSFNNWPLLGRLMPMGWFLVDPYIRLTAFCTGDPLTAANGLLRADNACTGTTFDVTSSDYEIENGSGAFFGLPVHDIRGIYCDGSLALNGGTQFVRYRWRDGALATDGVKSHVGNWSNAKARILFLAARAGVNQLPDLQLKDGASATTEDYDFTVDGCRLRYMDADDPEVDGGGPVVDGAINACYPDLPLVKTGSEFWVNVLKGTTNPVGDNTFLQLAGGICWSTDADGNRTKGLYYQTLDGNSWSYSGFYGNTASTTGDKNFSRDQIRPWLDVTTLDPDQQVVFIQNIADENNSLENHQTKLENLITEGDAWCDGITTHPPKYLFIVQFAHEITGDPDEERQNQLDKAAACYAIATDPTYAGRVGFISIFQMMDGNYGTDDASSGLTGGLAAYETWATNRGWDAYTNGVITPQDLTGGILDPNLHLGGQYQAMAVASLVTFAISMSESSQSTGAAVHRGRRF